MLAAEIHGKVVREARDNEDYLTSAVFGHLRYVGPKLFWSEFLARASGLPVEGRRQSLMDLALNQGVSWNRLDRVDVSFWPVHKLGIPDLVVVFTGAETRALVLIVEAKLWAGKSGTGDDDQLLRYLRLVDDLYSLGLNRSGGEQLADAVRAVIYLPPTDPLPDMLETAALCANTPTFQARLFGAEWQDIVEAADAAMSTATGMPRLVLGDVAAFLRQRGLEYFRGFHTSISELLTEETGLFYGASTLFQGFAPGTSGNRTRRDFRELLRG